MRLGFAVKALGRQGLKSHDTRRWQNNPHLSVSLAYLRDMLLYLDEADIRMYRMGSDLAPYVANPDMPQFHDQVADCALELAHVGQLARELDIRLSFHAHPYTVLNSPDPGVHQRSVMALVALARILDGMGLGPEAVIVTHVGGIYGDREASLARYAERFGELPEHVRRRLVLENDDTRYGVADIGRVHRATGIRLVFDRLHFLLNNPERLPLREALEMALATWPKGVTHMGKAPVDVAPKIHFSSPRTEMKALPPAAMDGRADAERVRPALWRNHSDYINPFEFIDFLRAAQGARAFDVMLEAKGKDLAVDRLRRDVLEYAPELARAWGITQRCA